MPFISAWNLKDCFVFWKYGCISQKIMVLCLILQRKTAMRHCQCEHLPDLDVMIFDIAMFHCISSELPKKPTGSYTTKNIPKTDFSKTPPELHLKFQYSKTITCFDFLWKCREMSKHVHVHIFEFFDMGPLRLPLLPRTEVNKDFCVCLGFRRFGAVVCRKDCCGCEVWATLGNPH